MQASSGPSSVQSTPNVTPMIDVMLVLLIIFMVVAPALMAGFNATPPEGVNLKDHPEDEQTDQVLGIASSTFVFPYLHIRFIEIVPGAATGLSDQPIEADPGASAGAADEEETEADLELDEDFLKRIRDV